MKITQFAIALLIGASFMSCQNSSNVAIVSQADSVSYVLGAFQGERIIQSFERMKIDSMIDMDLYLKGFDAASKGKDLKMNPDSSKSFLDGFFQELQQNQMMAARDTTGNAEGFNPNQSAIDSVSYLLGADFGRGLTESFEKDGMDTILNVALVTEAFIASINNEELKLETEANRSMLDVFFQKIQEDKLLAEYGHVKAEGEEYLAKNKGNSDVVETASGLQYEILVEGNGEIPTYTNRVNVTYRGTLVDGTEFDSGTTTFGVGQVIRGWTEALQLMPVGSKWKLAIPYDLAYGTRPRPGGAIRPFDALIFEVELLAIEK